MKLAEIDWTKTVFLIGMPTDAAGVYISHHDDGPEDVPDWPSWIDAIGTILSRLVPAIPFRTHWVALTTNNGEDLSGLVFASSRTSVGQLMYSPHGIDAKLHPDVRILTVRDLPLSMTLFALAEHIRDHRKELHSKATAIRSILETL